MKKLLFTIIISGVFQIVTAQQRYTINTETLELKTEVEGELDLLWNIIDNQYRYFIRSSDGIITELTNTQGSDNTFQDEYKAVLSRLTNGMSTEKVKLTLYSLKDFINRYNATISGTKAPPVNSSQLEFRLGFSGGITNNPFVINPDNHIAPLIGAELELYDANVLRRHAGFVQARHAFEADDFNYATTELSVGYRYRFIHKPGVSFYGQVKLVTLNFTSIGLSDEDGRTTTQSDTLFDIPFILGLGTDIKVGNNGYITVIYGELYALFLDSPDNFSTDISIGYKFNL
jgi:hypothetical protein